jgi:hypothetical protein
MEPNTCFEFFEETSNRVDLTDIDKSTKHQLLQIAHLPLFCLIKLNFRELGQVNWQLTKQHNLIIHIDDTTEEQSGRNDDVHPTTNEIDLFIAKWHNPICKVEFHVNIDYLSPKLFSGCGVVFFMSWLDNITKIMKFIETKEPSVALSIEMVWTEQTGHRISKQVCEIIAPYISDLVVIRTGQWLDCVTHILQNSLKMECLTIGIPYDHLDGNDIQPLIEKICEPKRIRLLKFTVLSLGNWFLGLLEKYWVDELVVYVLKPNYELGTAALEEINNHPTLKTIQFFNNQPIDMSKINKKVGCVVVDLEDESKFEL